MDGQRRSVGAGEAATEQKNDIESLLAAVRTHQRQHYDCNYDDHASDVIQRCKTMLTKLRKLLPKVMRPIATLPVDVGVPMLKDLCKLLELLLRGNACPHSLTLFMENATSNGNATHIGSTGNKRNGSHRMANPSVSPSGATSFPTVATMLFYMVSFYSNERLKDAQREVLDVTLQLVLFLQRNDIYGFLHFLRDSVEALQDCFLVEESLKNRDMDADEADAAIACYLDTAIHVYQDSDGPLGPKNSTLLCGCEPITDMKLLCERKEQLKQLLPPIHIMSYNAAIGIRRSLIALVDRVVQDGGVLIENERAFDKICRLLPAFLSKDASLLENSGRRRSSHVLQLDVIGVAQSTLQLIKSMLLASLSAERRFIRLTTAYFESSSFSLTCPGLVEMHVLVLEAIQQGFDLCSSIAIDSLWPSFHKWLSRCILQYHKVKFENHDTSTHYKLWKPTIEVLAFYLRHSEAIYPIARFIDLICCADVVFLDTSLVAVIIDQVHWILSTRSFLVQVSHSMVKSLSTGSSYIKLGLMKKRKRDNDSVCANENQSTINIRSRSSEEEMEPHQKLARWIMDLIFYGGDSMREDIAALSVGLRVLMPFRDMIAKLVRLESLSVFRIILQRIDSLVSVSNPPAAIGTFVNEYLELLLVLSLHLDDNELGKYSTMYVNVLQKVESQNYFVDATNVDTMDRTEWTWNSRDRLRVEIAMQFMTNRQGVDSKEELYNAARSAEGVTGLVCDKATSFRAIFLLYFMWSRPKAFKLNTEESWRDTTSWKILYRSLLQEKHAEIVTKISVCLTPVLVYLLGYRGLATPKEVITCILEIFNAKVQPQISEAVMSAMVKACGNMLCAGSAIQAPPKTQRANNNLNAREAMYGTAADELQDDCQCWTGGDPSVSIAVPIVLFEPILMCGEHLASEIIQVHTSRSISCIAFHCVIDVGDRELMSRFIYRMLSMLESPFLTVRCTVSRNFSQLVCAPGLLHALLLHDRDGTAHVIDELNRMITNAEDDRDDKMLMPVMTVLGSLGCGCNIQDVQHVEVIIWLLLRLTALWSKYQLETRPERAASACDQINRITMRHQVSWRRLCVEYPELCYFPLVDTLLISRNLKLFLRTFMGGKVDATVFLLASAPFVLPKYVVDQNQEMLQCFIVEYNGTDEDRAMYEDGSEDQDLRAATITELLLNHIEFVLKELIIHQVQADNNDNRIAEWEFLFKFLPENSTIRDVISHSPLRLLNLLAWELGGPRHNVAKRAFREISQYLHQDQQNETNGHTLNIESDQFLMPRQYFLALMTDLGNKIGGKGADRSSLSNRIRAIRSIHRLFGLFKNPSSDVSHSSGIMDPFVPKVMATLKIGLIEKDLQVHAMKAWGTFLRMLSTKALEANFSSIVVSLLPCLGYDTFKILEDDIRSDVRFWNIDALPCESATENQSPTRNDGDRRSAALAAQDALKYLFIEKRNELKGSFPRIPLLPSIPELDEIYIVLEAEVGDPEHKPLDTYLSDLASYVNHWDMAVREMSLMQLFRCLVVRGSELESLMQNEDVFVEPAIVNIVLSVLQLARTENQESIKLLCARCLGALGAIDAARMPLSMFYGSSGSKEKTDQRIEYSTKDLACVLIESLLVKELRAAPENTDSVAFAIQELLKFLAELTADPQHSGQSLSTINCNPSGHRSKADARAVMPEWMKRRFERKDVLQFVEPYWSTNYTVSSSRQHSSSGRRASGDGSADRGLHPALDDITYYEKYDATYEEWLLAWCKRLIHISQPPERKIFWACRTALPTCPQLARFLLPYLIQNVLRSGRPEIYGELKREVMAVLKDQDRGIMIDDFMNASPETVQMTTTSTLCETTNQVNTRDKSFGEYSSRHHQCAQTIFSTIDELNEWVWSSEKKRLALSGSSSRQSMGSARSVDIPSELEDQEKEYLEEFLKDIPSRSLSNAAYAIKAYARAIQYFEVFLRQQDSKSFDSKDSNKHATGPINLALIAKNAYYLQQLYKSVDEPDALTGLATLRRLYDAHRHNDNEDSRSGDREDGLSLTDLMHQIVDHEQLAQWEDALACYELAIQEIQSVLSSRTFYSSLPARSQHSIPPLSIHGMDGETHMDPEVVKPELYSGMISCLIQLGRLESALQHINGIVTQEPNMMGTLYPSALECAWRLSRWELLSDLLVSEKQNLQLLASSASTNSSGYSGGLARLRTVDVSHLMLVRVLHSLHAGEQESFKKNLKDARLDVMGPLAAASAESYQRAYPLLHKLHFLHEAEQGFIAIQTSKEINDADQRNLRWNKQCPWNIRYDLMATSLKFRDPILALRRVMLQEADLRNEVSNNWLLYAKLARKEGYIRTASSAVMHADALDNQYALLEKAKLMVSQDRMYEALQILEPVDIDASKLDFDVEDPHYCAKNLLLATNWMQESGQRQGKKVIERYQAVIQFDPKWEKGYFFLAKYYEYLLSVSHPEATGPMGDEGSAIILDSVFHSHLINLMKNYVKALAHGTKFVFQSLPRLLTLWFEYGEVLHTSATGERKTSKANKTLRHIEIGLSQVSVEQQLLTDITQVIHDAADSLPAYEWLVCFPQVTSRICHPNPTVVEGVKKIMVKVLISYPTQAMWPLLGLSRSLNAQRRNRARDIIAITQRQFVSNGQQDIANSFSEGMRLVEELINLASHDPANQRRIHIRLSRIRTVILVPVQAALTTILPASGLAPPDDKHSAFSPHAQVHIKAFSDKADVMMTKEKPKRIEILGSDGMLYPFLCKREKTGDLRKDARMMEFNSMINKLLQKDAEGRKRKLRLRTYAVVCLNEESGLMEWVRNTKAMRQLIGQIHKTERGFIQPVRLTHEIKERFLGMQKKYADNIHMMAVYYSKKILTLPVFTPRFHQWFYNNFADPTGWFEARLAFSRSAAVWSMVGHIIGLGDRHGENILIDCTNGECVHVDFDCLFDKGLKLAKPEIVPFRLTPNIIDAFGITGYEGVFRRVCEVTMRLLRDNKETLRSVLESFIHDPLVEWGRKGKAAMQSSAATTGGTTSIASGAGGRSIADISNDRSKEETRIILKTIDDRLRGIYNLGDAIRPLVSSSHRNILPENETLPLSVQGQVDKLIHEATSNENLAQMYIGWMPFL